MFSFDGEHHPYARDVYNATEFNERTVEIPLARQFIREHGIDVEVGNVLRHYGHTQHRVIDRYDSDPHVENLDIFDIAGPVGTLVAISTVEHVRWDEPGRDPDGAIRALEHLRCISDRLFVTVPMGYHPALDQHLLHGPHKATTASTMIRTAGGWEQTPEPVWKPYGASTAWAESVWIGTWL